MPFNIGPVEIGLLLVVVVVGIVVWRNRQGPAQPTPTEGHGPVSTARGRNMMAGQTQPYGPTKYCQACGGTIDSRAEVCPLCGVRQAAPGAYSGWTDPTSQAAAPASKFCHACRAQIDARAEICPKCGVRQPSLGGTGGGGVGGDATTRTGKSKLAASLLAIFLGGLGIHKFYLGDTTLGVIYLIFFWTAIPAIIGFVEGIIWLTQPNEVWLAKYGDR